VECSYHGLEFDAQSGQCQLVPSLTADQRLKVERIYAGSYPCQEHDDYIWVFIPNRSLRQQDFLSRRAAISATASPKFSEKYKIAHLTADCPAVWIMELLA